MKTIRFKRLTEDAILPVKKTAGAIAFDLAVPRDVRVESYRNNDGRQAIPLGFAISLPENHEAKIEARSGFSLKGMEGYFSETINGHVHVDDMPERFFCDVITGKVDCDYRGEVNVLVHNRDCAFVLKAGTRIAQMTIYYSEPCEFEVVDELDDTERADGGLGHTGSK